MIRSFASDGTRDVFDGVSSKRARKICPTGLWSTAARKLDHLNQAEVLRDLRAPPGNRLEALSGNQRGQPTDTRPGAEPLARPDQKSWARLLREIFEVDPLLCEQCRPD